MDQILRLHQSRDDVGEEGQAEKRTRLLEWLAFHNPCAGKEATYYVAEENGIILAFQGRMPLEFLIQGIRRKGYYVHDTYVHPEARARGIGFSLITALAEVTERESDSFFCLLGGTPLNLKIQRRMGYREIPPAPQYVKFLNPRRQLKRILKLPVLVSLLAPLVRLALTVTDFFLLAPPPSSSNISTVDRFDSRFDRLMEQATPSDPICPVKTSAYLNWRYVDRPFRRDTILVSQHNGSLKGAVVFCLSPYRTGARTGVIVDLLAQPGDETTTSSLVRSAILELKRMNVEAITCIITNTQYERVFRKYGFRKDKSGKAVLLGNLHKASFRTESLLELSNWHISRGDSDGFMLSSST
jgi:GNAT superfamily N-acetyltransferase